MNIIELGKNEHQLFADEQCMKCKQKFILNKFMVQYGMFRFHLTCFKKYAEDQIKAKEETISGIRRDIECLKPYAKEMICETLLKEKYG